MGLVVVTCTAVTGLVRLTPEVGPFPVTAEAGSGLSPTNLLGTKVLETETWCERLVGVAAYSTISSLATCKKNDRVNFSYFHTVHRKKIKHEYVVPKQFKICQYCLLANLCHNPNIFGLFHNEFLNT